MVFACLWSLFWTIFKVIFGYRLIKAFMRGRHAVRHWLYPKIGWTTDLTPYKEMWTVVTGCTDGIGKAYTMELAKRGIKKFVLVGRNSAKLQEIKKTLTSINSAVQTETLQIDMATDNLDKLEALSKYKVAILVNCAGTAINTMETFTDQPKGTASEILRVNAVSLVKVLEAVLPGMAERDKGIVVTVASIQGWRPQRHFSTYTPSKACISYLSQGLSMDYAGTNLKFQCLLPILVATKMSKYTDADCGRGWYIVPAADYAREAVDIIGMTTLGCGCFVHEIQASVFNLVPGFMQQFAGGPIFAMERKRLAALAGKAKAA